MDAARALAAMGADAAGAVRLLEVTLLHSVREVRTASAGALAAIGPTAASAWRTLSNALGDPHPSVRRSAAVALGAIGEKSAPAVSRLVTRLDDPNVHVRVSIVEALGRIGTEATVALDALDAASKDPALRSQVAWAVARIEGREISERSAPTVARAMRFEPPPAAYATADSWRVLCGGPSRNAVVRDAKIPYEWDAQSGKNIRWSVPLGEITYGTPMISHGRVYIGTDNARPRVGHVQGEQGILFALRDSDGEWLWQDAAPSLDRGIDNFLLPTTSSSPLLADDRLYYLTAQGELRCLEQRDDAPVLVWKLDLSAELGVFPHEAPNCAVLPFGNALLLCTSNGVDEAHANIPAPRAPSFIAVHRTTGRVLWSVVGPSPDVLHGQWSSPALVDVRARSLALFGGGDGQLYALEAASGEEVWRFDGNSKDAVWRRGSDVDERVARNNIIACPVVHDGLVYLTMGQDPNHGHGRGTVYALDPGVEDGDTTQRELWRNDEVGRAIATPIVDDGLLYVADLNGFVWCLDISDGRTVWKHDLFAPVWSCLLLADGKLYVGDEDGGVTVFRAGRKKQILSRNELGASIWSGASVANETLYIATTHRLWAIGLTKCLGGKSPETEKRRGRRPAKNAVSTSPALLLESRSFGAQLS